MNLAILGPQGSGKGTQAEKVSKKYNLYYFEMGQFLRNLAKSKPEIDEIINKRGVLLEDNVVFDLLKNELEGKNIYSNILFDGYPRSIRQYELISEFLQSKGSKIDKVIYLELPDEEAIKRLSARRIDNKTGEIYNLITNPPPVGVNQQGLLQRPDDQPEAIGQRLKLYHSTTAPLVEHLSDKNLVIKIDGTKSIDAIFNQICIQLEGVVNGNN